MGVTPRIPREPIDLFREVQTDYPELELELRIAMVQEDEQNIANLLYITNAETVDLIETIPTEDPEEWQTRVESIEIQFQFEISEDATGIWTNSSAPILTQDFEPSGAVLDVFVHADD